MPKPERLAEARAALGEAIRAGHRPHEDRPCRTCEEVSARVALVFVRETEAAYKRGLIAGRSQAGYREKPAPTGLTYRQMEVARLAAEGMNNRTIAQHLFISEETVKTHMRAVLKVTGTRTRTQMAAILAAQGHITPRKE